MRGWSTAEFPKNFTLYHSSQKINDVEPFMTNYETLGRDVILPLKLKLGDWVSAYNWKSALYIIGKNTPPTWYQITLEVNQSFMNSIREQGNTRSFVKIDRATD